MNLPDPESITLGAVFIAGLATSLHCAGMCGLLTCGLGIAGRGPALATVGIYHGTRLIGYAIAGAVAGAVGGFFGLGTKLGGLTWLPVLLVIFLVAIAFGLEKKIGTIPVVGKLSHRIRVKAFSFPPQARAAVVGLSTPLLPCGPLYALLALALSTGSAVEGTQVMLAFGLGAIPAIWATQVGSAWLGERLSAKSYVIARRTLAALAALSLVWHYTLLSPVMGAERSTCRCESTTE